MQNSNRYQIIHKLDDGSYSTVWLAIDKVKSKHVALKNPKRQARNDEKRNKDTELKIWQHIQKLKESVVHAGAWHIISLLGHYKSIDGKDYYVLELVDGNIAKNLSVKLSKVNNTRENGFPLWVTKTILRQTLWGMDFLHQQEIVHGDLHAGNILFKLDAYDRLSIKLTNFGSDPRALRALELIVADKFDQTIDIWSFGCLMFELITKTYLFDFNDDDGDRGKSDLDHLQQMVNHIGDPPPYSSVQKWISKHITTSKDTTNENRNNMIDNNTIGNNNNKNTTTTNNNNNIHNNDNNNTASSHTIIANSLEEKFSKSIPEGSITTKEGFLIISIMRETLQFETTMRSSFSDLLRQSWFFGQ